MIKINDIIDRALFSDDRLAAALATKRSMSTEAVYNAGYTRGAKPATSPFAYRLGGTAADIARALRSECDRLGASIAADRETVRLSDRRMEAIQRELTALKEMEAFLEAPPTLTPTTSSLFHKVVESGLNKTLMGIEEELGGPRNVSDDEWALMRDEAQVFTIDHDWADAFKNYDTTGGEVRPPYDVSCFEMTVSGRRCCYMQTSTIGAIVFVLTSTGWFFFGRYEEADKTSTAGQFMAAQVRAVCISLDAEVAIAETVRAPCRLNAARAERGKLPLFDYRTVALARKPRAAPLANSGGAGRHKRLHWRRGHWRHFATHKTWIKWMLVGDPDLGFIDKHYCA